MKSTLVSWLSFLLCFYSCSTTEQGIEYVNPRVYNVEYTFEITPNPATIDRRSDLKVWAPIPREWDSQRNVQILSVVPEPHARYDDPEYGNSIYYWNFGGEPERSSYKFRVKLRLESYEIHAVVDPAKVEPYDTASEEYQLYTGSGHTTHISPEIREMARIAVGEERNPYLQAQRIWEFVQKRMRYEQTMERGIDFLLTTASVDKETGELYLRGACGQHSALFVALARAAGIPARSVQGFVGWAPHLNHSNSHMYSSQDSMISAGGFAGAEHHGLGPHVWAEFFIPGYGWIPSDPTWGGLEFGFRPNRKVIMGKGRDVPLGLDAPQAHHEGYGFQWVPIYEGRADLFQSPVWNIGKLRGTRVEIYHTLDPFPADAFADYASNLYPEKDEEEKLQNWREEHMLSFYNAAKKSKDTVNIFEKDNRLCADRETYLCQVLRDITGNEKFQQIFETYLNLRLTTGEPVSTEKFREIAEKVYRAPLDFFFKEWLGNKSLPQISLDNVVAEKREKIWIVHGHLLQDGKTFHIPVEMILKTDIGQEKKKLWIDSNNTSFEFITSNKPEKLTVDPDFHIPATRWMPPRLEMLWDSYPDLTVIYGTLAEAEANKTAAERFVDEFAGLGHEVIKADTEVTENDLRKSIILFGRPETNKIAQRFSESFPVKFEKDTFTWRDSVYDLPTQGAALIIENPLDSRNTINLYAGLSGDATLKVCDKSEWQEELDRWFLIGLNASYIIYDGHKRLLSGDWEDTESNLVWNFK